MTTNLRTTIIGVAIIALTGYGFYVGIDKDILFALIGCLTAGGFLLAKDGDK